jgi:FkbM family methyltransferase
VITTLGMAAAAKAAVRQVTRRAGYDIVHTGATFGGLQRLLLARCDLLVDVGANVGQYADLSRALGFRARIVSFEPLSDAFAILDRRSATTPTWEARNVALGAERGTSVLQVSANSVSSSLLPIRDEHVRAAPKSRLARTEEVAISTLDDQLRDVSGDSVWLKLDVQGFELSVVKGGPETLDRVEVVQSELSLANLYDGQTDYLEFCQYLRDRGFRMCGVLPGFQDPASAELLQMDGLFIRASHRPR